MHLYLSGADPKIPAEHRSETSMPQHELDVILPADQAGRPPTFVLAQPGTALLHERQASVQREAPDMNGPILHPDRHRPASRCDHLNGWKGHDRLTYTRIHYYPLRSTALAREAIPESVDLSNVKC